MTIAHQRQKLHWLLFQSEYNSQTVQYLSRLPLFFLTCFQIVTTPKILSILNLRIWPDKAICWLRKSNSSRIFNLTKVGFTQMEVPQMVVRLSMCSQCICKGLVLPGMARLPSSSSHLRQSMVHFSLTHVLFLYYKYINITLLTDPIQPRSPIFGKSSLACHITIMSIIYLFFIYLFLSFTINAGSFYVFTK